ncbi:MAG: hydrogenase [Lentisphaeria bacterium]|nr:hydrogenase [Lentisphaeria bacterium]
MSEQFLILRNPGAAPLLELPLLPFAQFRRQALAAIARRKARVAAFFAYTQGGSQRLLLILAVDAEGILLLSSCEVKDSFASFTPEAPQFHCFEREIYEEHGLEPLGHPWLKPLRFNQPGQGEASAGVCDYFKLSGEAAHEVAVGPVHAGVIEPGHFRFQCVGEQVYSLEISLGYQHRGIERLLRQGPDQRSVHLLETCCGDSSCAYSGAYAQLLESLQEELRPSPRAEALRLLAWELERLANHCGDLGALANDVAFRPTMAYCGRLRGEFLNMTAELCGNRFGRGLIRPGGMGYDATPAIVAKLLPWLQISGKELYNALDLLFNNSGVLDRFENTGTLERKTAADIGLVGMAARASGLQQDLRSYHPYGWYRENPYQAARAESGDVCARAQIRYEEIKSSLQMVERVLKELPEAEEQEGAAAAPDLSLRPKQLAVSMCEAWRGELCLCAMTDEQGRFEQFKIVDPSFHNWFGLSMALRGEQISNFPLCNKSFNLSYCGHDL